MKHILHICPSYKPAFHYGGPTVSVSRLAEVQAQNDAQVSVFTTTADGPEELKVVAGARTEVDGVTVFYFNRLTGDHGHFSPALYRALWREARHFQTVHLHSWWNWVVFGALLLCRIKGIRTIVSPHGMLSPYTVHSKIRPWFQKTFGRWLLANSILHATSKQEQKELQILHPELEVVLAPNIMLLPTPPPQRPVKSADTLDLLFLSRIDPKKGLDILLDALATLQTSDWKLTIAGASGSTYQKQLVQLSKKLGLEERVHWAGWTDGDTKWALLAQSDLMILPSHNENFANVVLEALFVGTPVIVSDQVGLHDYVREKELGWLCRPNPEALREVLQQAFADTQRREKISSIGQQRVLADFEPRKVVRLYFQHYAQLREQA